ncbi:DUF2490 domain-containing protein [Spirosoma pollinicola]|uniref:DUF2490 domain-containing protein n=1 Tax=Spirosoma pollinicola TaxID=2057025 RepID=A0A2K8YWJ4_9BACT|nr:DUF2490 domain-containing protein [Spirosoma pollinicola]AUD01969.1 DUF2490 domain-containing protein [Spirosoma pollinicola]
MIRLLFTLSLVNILLVGTFSRSVAQTSLTPSTTWGSWMTGTIQLPAGKRKWGGFAELQARSNGVFNQFFYFDVKSGITYEIDRTLSLMVAGAQVSTYDYKALADGPLNTETRLWEQLTLNQFVSRIKFEHRYRIEQRWFNFRNGTMPYRNRIRYRFNTLLPLNNYTITNKTAFLSIYDEIFVNPIGPVFERNRIYAGVGYQFDNQWILQVGWMNQTNYDAATFDKGIFTPELATGKNNLIIGLTYRLKRKNAAEKLPTQSD